MRQFPNTSAKTKFCYRISLMALVVVWVAASCSTGGRQVRSDPDNSTQASSYSQSRTVEERILQEIRLWHGTRHKMGGSSSKGVDCSGFVQRIYRDAFKIDLPRTTRDQIKCGRTVRRADLQPGDLVFFKPPGYPRHVGIYLSESNFAHASKTKGVMISTIDPHYWGKYYWTARRIIALSHSH